MNRAGRHELLSWYLYDFANTSFTVVVVTVAYSIFFAQHVVGEPRLADLLWGAGNSLSMLLVGLSSPYLGAVSDGTARKKLFTGIYTAVCIAATALMWTVGRGQIAWGLFLFVLSNIGFQGGLVFYNAFLPQISPPDKIGYVSGMGFAWGYVGALCTLVIAMPFARSATSQGDYSLLSPVFPISALFFLIFAIPFFLFLRERPPQVRLTQRPWKEGWLRIRTTISNLSHYRNTARFLLAYFIYSDGINTVIAFGGLYAINTLGFTPAQVIFFFAVIQFAAVGGAWLFGKLTDRWGAKPTIELTLSIWLVMTFLAFFVQNAAQFYVVGALAGIAMGSSQAASRVLMAILTPVSQEAEFYGFYGLCGKFSAIMGTLLFGLVSSITGNQRLAVLSIAFFFALGWYILRTVDVTAGRQAVLQEIHPELTPNGERSTFPGSSGAED